MTVDPTLPQHDETIVPVRPGRIGTGAMTPPRDAQRARSAGARLPSWLTAAGVIVLVAGAAVAFVWLPQRVAADKAAREHAAAAALAVKDNCKPRDVDVRKLQELLKSQGAYLG